MNYKITFSTYVNQAGTSTPAGTIRDNLVAISKRHNIQGFTLANQTGYWAGELEASHALTLLDTSPEQAKAVALAIKSTYHQDAVILEALPETEVTFL